MSLPNYDLPITSVEELVEFALCDDNDSAGFDYLRGYGAFLKGRALDLPQSFRAFYWLRDDMDVSRLIIQVAAAVEREPFMVAGEVISHISRIYREHEEGEHGSV